MYLPAPNRPNDWRRVAGAYLTKLTAFWEAMELVRADFTDKAEIDKLANQAAGVQWETPIDPDEDCRDQVCELIDRLLDFVREQQSWPI